MEITLTDEREMPRSFKKTRRGKKRRLKPFIEGNTSCNSTAASRCHEFFQCEKQPEERLSAPLTVLEPLAVETDESYDTSVPIPLSSTYYCGASNQQRILRPLEVPKAPSNSTQFIMDDHENCNLYVSFESPSRYKRRRRSSETSTDAANGEYCTSPCMGYHDIDYEYESPDDLDQTAFFEKDFEMIYRRAREEELIALSRSDLVSQLIELERKANSIEQMLNGDVPSVAFLQEELLKLQEENTLLRKTNFLLKGGTLLTDDDFDDEEESVASNNSSTEFTGDIKNTSATTTESTKDSESEESDNLDTSTEITEGRRGKRDDLAVNIT